MPGFPPGSVSCLNIFLLMDAAIPNFTLESWIKPGANLLRQIEFLRSK